MTGKTEWVISDGFMGTAEHGEYICHEAVCVLNLSDTKARIDITVYFEDEDPMQGFTAYCDPQRTNHIRLDKIVNEEGLKIPKKKPYALYIKSNVPVIVQHTRMDVTQPEMALMTTIAYS